jgi:prephenate dehydrogenase
MMDILLTNREEVLKALVTYQAKLDDLTRVVAKGDEEEMRAVLNAVRDERMRMFP